MWIALVSLYGILKGVRDVIKKKALQKNSTMEVLFFYTLLSFVLVLPETGEALAVNTHLLGFIAIKSVIIFVAWICSFMAIDKLPISFFGVMDMSRVIFATVLGVAGLGEVITKNKAIGMVLVAAGLLLVNVHKRDAVQNDGAASGKYILLVLLSCFLNACSEMFDKILMKDMTSGQLQFWYMFFLVILYLGYILVTRTRINIKSAAKNYWILILSVLFVLGDRALFVACSDENSTVTAMTLIKQCSVLVTIIGGRIVFKESRTMQRILCACVIIAGIMIAVIQ